MVVWPELHGGVPGEESLPGLGGLLGVLVYNDDCAGEDEVSTARVLLVIVVLLAVLALSVASVEM